jgi:hypothetical protein
VFEKEKWLPECLLSTLWMILKKEIESVDPVAFKGTPPPAKSSFAFTWLMVSVNQSIWNIPDWWSMPVIAAVQNVEVGGLWTEAKVWDSNKLKAKTLGS